MERKGRKMLALGAVIMLCAVAIIGAGYAAFSNTAKASTYNEGNSANVMYMTLQGSGNDAATIWAPFTASEVENEFSEYTYSTGSGNSLETNYAYYLVTPDQTPITGYDVSKAVSSKSFVLENKTGETISAITIKSKVDAAIGNTDFKYVMGVKVGNGTETFVDVATAAMTFDNKAVSFDGNNKATITVTIYIAYNITGYIEPELATGEPVQNATETKTQGVHSGVAPVGFDSKTFAFSVNKYVAPANP